MGRLLLEGRAGSPGVGVGRLLWIAAPPPAALVDTASNGTGPRQEETRLRAALDVAAAELEELARETTLRAGAEVGSIFEAQAVFARDPGLVDPAIDLILGGASATAAIERAAAEQADRLAGVDDPYLRERAADLRDVASRVADRLMGRQRREVHHRDGTPAILAANDIEPSMVAAVRPELVSGIALSDGAPTGHAAILARALGIPLVLGVGASLEASCDGRTGIVDGGQGRVIVEPTPADLAAARSADGKRQTAVAPRGVADTTGGVQVGIEANVGSELEAAAAAEAGADGIGLVRTELLFLGRSVAAGLAEQRAVYRRIAATMPGRPVVFRTLDVGGDKRAGYLPAADEPNPALGVRGIRLGLRDPSLYETQLRALLEATPDEPLRLLLPMVATLEEVNEARTALERAASTSRAAGAAISSDVRLGIMIEVPATAIMADAFAPNVDFFSIGTNDLVQYTLAADRTSADLAELASPLQPSVLRLVGGAVRAAATAGIPVSVCGEAAADPSAGPLLIGLGVTRLSVAPRSVAEVRTRLRSLDVDACREAAIDALAASTAAEVREIADRLGRAPSPAAERP